MEEGPKKNTTEVERLLAGSAALLRDHATVRVKLLDLGYERPVERVQIAISHLCQLVVHIAGDLEELTDVQAAGLSDQIKNYRAAGESRIVQAHGVDNIVHALEDMAHSLHHYLEQHPRLVGDDYREWASSSDLLD